MEDRQVKAVIAAILLNGEFASAIEAGGDGGLSSGPWNLVGTADLAGLDYLRDRVDLAVGLADVILQKATPHKRATSSKKKVAR